MDNARYGRPTLAAACLLAMLAWGGGAAAPSSAASSGSSAQTNPPARSDEAQDAFEHIDKAVRVLHRMETDPALKTALQQAKGVYVVADYGGAALGVGGRGGAGVLLVKRGGNWADPAFYNIGSVSVGAQAGIEGGAIAMILNDQKALDSFKQDNKFSLNADAGLTVLAWSGKAQGSAGRGNITVWSDSKGLFGDLAVSVTDVHFDRKETAAYYRTRTASARDVIDGQLRNPHAATLQRALAAMPSATEPGMPATSSGGSSPAKGTSGSASGNR